MLFTVFYHLNIHASYNSSRVTLTVSLLKIDFGFELIEKKRLHSFTLLNMYSLTLNAQEYEELTSQLFLYKIIT